MGGGKPRQDDTWVVEFYTEYGDVFTRSIGEDKVPKSVKDRKFDGDFGAWLRKHFGTSAKIQDLRREDIFKKVVG
jgi:hypothetical protein